MSSRSQTPAIARPRAALDGICLGLLALALLMRGGVLLFAGGALRADPDGYRALAKNLIEFGVFGAGERPTAYRPPLYPLLLAPCEALGDEAWSRIAVGVLHVALGVGAALLTLWIGRRWGLGHWSALAAALVACDPILLNQSTLVMTETLAALSVCTSLAALSWHDERPAPARAALAGLGLGLAALCRPTFLAWAALVAAFWLLRATEGRRRMASLGALVVGLAAVLAPWALRNLQQFGRPIVSTTHGGYTLLLGNNPSYYDFMQTANPGDVWHADEFDRQVAQARAAAGDDELTADRRENALAWQTIRAQPMQFLRACLRRVGSFWGLLPHQTADDAGLRRSALRYAAASWYFAEFMLAAAGLCVLRSRLWRSAWLWGMLLAASLTAVHALYWSDMRMRAPLEPVAALLAARGAGALWTWLCAAKRLATWT